MANKLVATYNILPLQLGDVVVFAIVVVVVAFMLITITLLNTN